MWRYIRWVEASRAKHIHRPTYVGQWGFCARWHSSMIDLWPDHHLASKVLPNESQNNVLAGPDMLSCIKIMRCNLQSSSAGARASR
jgi:hypothetical protein